MSDPFAAYSKSMEAFVQGGKTDFAALYAATDKLRRLNFVDSESTPLMNFYSDVAERYRQKVKTAKAQQASMKETIEAKYAEEEKRFLAMAKAQWEKENQSRSGGKHNFNWFDTKELATKIQNATTIQEFKQLAPSFSLVEYGSSLRGDRDKRTVLKFFSSTGERKSAAEIYERTLDEDFGRYAATETDISTFGDQSASSASQLEAERAKLIKENERKRREFLETKQKLLTSAEEIGRAKRPSYIERPL